MLSLDTIDAGQAFDWGRTSADYAHYRPGPPDSFYAMLANVGVGAPGQRLLDLGTGTGLLAREFARRGARVCGIDISPRQIEVARSLAVRETLEVDFRVGAAERAPYAGNAFEAITANQCWLYFDRDKAIGEARRLLVDGGVLVISHFSWLPRQDPIARASEKLVLKHNPHWSSANWSGRVNSDPQWAREHLRVRAMFYYDVPIVFTRESWRGRLRACRGVGAALSQDQVRAFDGELAALLERIAGEQFTILHRIDAHLFEFKKEPRPAGLVPHRRFNRMMPARGRKP